MDVWAKADEVHGFLEQGIALVELVCQADALLEVAVDLIGLRRDVHQISSQLAVLAEDTGAGLGQLGGLLQPALHFLRAGQPLLDDALNLAEPVMNPLGDSLALLHQAPSLGPPLPHLPLPLA